MIKISDILTNLMKYINYTKLLILRNGTDAEEIRNIEKKKNLYYNIIK